MNELSTKIYSFDPKFIIKNYLDQRLWSKEWTIFEYDGFKFTLRLHTIWTYDMSLSLSVKIEKDEFLYSTSFFIYLENDDQDSLIHKRLISSVISLIERYEKEQIEKSEEYRNAQQLSINLREKLTATAKNFMKKQNITNKRIVKYYVDGYVSDNMKYFGHKVIEANIRRTIPYLYIAWLAYVGDKKRLAEFVEQNPTRNTEYVIQEIEDFKKFLEDNDLITNLEKLLPPLNDEEEKE